jgi:hypothetical protein
LAFDHSEIEDLEPLQMQVLARLALGPPDAAQTVCWMAAERPAWTAQLHEVELRDHATNPVRAGCLLHERRISLTGK